MQSKISLDRSLFFVGVGGITSSLIFLIVIFFLGLPNRGSYAKLSSLTSRGTSQNLIRGNSVEPSVLQANSSLGSGLPVRLKIPSIYVDAGIEIVGLASDGSLGVPKGPNDVGWYKLGQQPGEKGTAVIDGHFGIWEDGEPSVFDNLYKLRPGDKIYIEDDKGQIISFAVSGSKNFDPTADASGVYYSNDGKAHLNLITCEGTWDKTSKSYSKRLIVFADKETDQ